MLFTMLNSLLLCKHSQHLPLTHLLMFWGLMGRRAERVVQRYRAARRFNIDRERIFSAYLTFGGIRTVPDPHSQTD